MPGCLLVFLPLRGLARAAWESLVCLSCSRTLVSLNSRRFELLVGNDERGTLSLSVLMTVDGALARAASSSSWSSDCTDRELARAAGSTLSITAKSPFLGLLGVLGPFFLFPDFSFFLPDPCLFDFLRSVLFEEDLDDFDFEDAFELWLGVRNPIVVRDLLERCANWQSAASNLQEFSK